MERARGEQDVHIFIGHVSGVAIPYGKPPASSMRPLLSPRPLWRIAVLTLSVTLGWACDVQGPPHLRGPIEVTGRVVLAPGGQPIEGMSVALMRYVSGLGAYQVVTIQTDAEGRFRLRYDVDEAVGVGFLVEVNEPYDSRFTDANFSLPPPPVRRDLGTIELRLNDAP